jgi:hypothetical protein
LWIGVILVIIIAISRSSAISSQFTDRKLAILSLTACLAALIFPPALRMLPDQLGFIFFFIAFWVTLGIVSIAVIASLVRMFHHRRKESLPSLIISLFATVLFYVNSATPLLWPYRSF